ncbi:hypothetical protein LZ32DRAFT_611558 [Colletotrichum eremochloae]|nr:hypothetical protein LZ32DRAFT_611558 [Colletotrichum eremochloae]
MVSGTLVALSAARSATASRAGGFGHGTRHGRSSQGTRFPCLRPHSTLAATSLQGTAQPRTHRRHRPGPYLSTVFWEKLTGHGAPEPKTEPEPEPPGGRSPEASRGTSAGSPAQDG